MRRILYFFDSSHRGVTALEQVASFASQRQAELRAVFIEDQNLMRCADLPFGREISLLTGRTRPLRVDSLRRQLRLAHNRFRGCLEQASRRQPLRWSLEVSHTAYDDYLSPAAVKDEESEDEVLLLTDFPGQNLVVELPRWVRFPGAVMLLRQDGHQFQQLLIYCDQVDAVPELIEYAIRLAGKEQLPLQFLLPAQSADLLQLRACIENRVQGSNVLDVCEWQLRHLLMLTEGQAYLLLLSKRSSLLQDGSVLKSTDACLLLP